MTRPIVITDSREQEKLQQFLQEVNLPYWDIQFSGNLFVGYANEQGDLIASGGLEFYGDYALLRSIAVKKTERGRKLGQQIVHDLIAIARDRQIQSVFLLTETARDFFLKNGFQDIPRNLVPEIVTQSAQFASTCPSSAACMMMKLT